MATREIANDAEVNDIARHLLELGNDIQANYDATANRSEIAEAGRLASSLGDWLYFRPTVEQHQQDRLERISSQTRSSWLSRFKDVVDTTLEWLEYSGRLNVQKQEQVLRGLYNLTELANHAHVFAIMELACACLNASDDPFPGQRQYIVQCLEDVKSQQQQIATLVEQASSILSEILQNEGVDYLKGRQFDNVVREARVQIESCRRRLIGAEEAILELSQKMGTVKWASRAIRATGFGFSVYVLFKRYQESSQTSMDLLTFGGCSFIAGWLWMSLFPGKESVYYESLSTLAADHRHLQEKLEDLRVSLTSAKDHRDGL